MAPWGGEVQVPVEEMASKGAGGGQLLLKFCLQVRIE